MKVISTGKTLFVVGVLALLIPTSVRAEKETLGVSEVKPTPAVAHSVDKAGKKVMMERVIQSLDGQLIDRINSTRKFEVVARSDLRDVFKEQEFATSGNVAANDKSSAQQFKIAGVKHLLVTTVDDFQDYTETATFQGTNRSATKRVFRLSCVSKLYDSTTGKLLESTNFQINNKDFTENKSYSTRDGELSDELIVMIARDMASKIANRVIDVIFPPKVLAKSDKQVTINRGDGTDIAVGQIWNVFAVGADLIDPDTNENLGKEESQVGKIKITSVLPKSSSAEILEDYGIDKSAILRKAQ